METRRRGQSSVAPTLPKVIFCCKSTHVFPLAFLSGLCGSDFPWIWGFSILRASFSNLRRANRDIKDGKENKGCAVDSSNEGKAHSACLLAQGLQTHSFVDAAKVWIDKVAVWSWSRLWNSQRLWQGVGSVQVTVAKLLQTLLGQVCSRCGGGKLELLWSIDEAV